MLKLGVLGGMGPASTYKFFEMIVNKTDAASDQEHLDMVLLNHSSLPDRTRAIKEGGTLENKVLTLLRQNALFLQNSGADIIVMPCNTAHYFFHNVQKFVNRKMINMVWETVHEVSKLGKKKVAVLATEGTIISGIYKKVCNELNVAYFAPDAKTQKVINKIIYDQIKKGEKGSEHDFLMVENAILSAGCDGAILACTELSVFKENNMKLFSEFYIDAMEVLAKKSILLCGGKVKPSN